MGHHALVKTFRPKLATDKPFEETNMFKGLGSIGNIASMMGAMQQIPEKLHELNERMKNETVSREFRLPAGDGRDVRCRPSSID